MSKSTSKKKSAIKEPEPVTRDDYREKVKIQYLRKSVEDYVDIGERLSKLMEMAGLNAKEISRQSGIPYPSIYYLLNKNSRNVTYRSILEFSRFFGLNASQFLAPKCPKIKKMSE